ncbi:DEAD-box helicase 56 [Homo sapiens]|uniref:RNA helicase n=1 Tax=Homo sapiens TaxID=9606 RepID=F8WEI3_HUMAN|nr:DEAD-box helicase 56 [Homo sapiens]KAI4013690.1 DEAD-box helicase 56 [Homo sapiens]
MEDSEALGFEHMGLDPRLLQAVTDLGWSRPTLIQEKAIPLALEGKDLLARARTGSGKTAAYAIPMLQLLLHRKASCADGEARCGSRDPISHIKPLAARQPETS